MSPLLNPARPIPQRRDWNRLIVGAAGNRFAAFGGQSLAAIAKERRQDPWETFFELVEAEAFVLPESMSEANVVRALQHDFVSFCTDVGPLGGPGARIASHPRACGAFPRLFARYVREQRAITLERAVAQASAVAAGEIMARDRGRLAVGLAADVIVFDFDRFTDRASFAEPRRLAEGMKHVLVGGEIVWEEGRLTGRRPGRVLRGPGYRPSPAPPEATNATAPLDRFFAEFVERHRVPGCAVAVMKQGRLAYARGFGDADVTERTPVTPSSLFRIASLSKPITAVAILQLVERGELRLDTPVFELLNDLPPLPDAKVDQRQRRITVRHLLEHRGGWDREKSFDAMFQSLRFADAVSAPPPAGPTEIIRCMRGQPLDFEPGERFAYSNYGYCLLGRVIEKIARRPYADYVRARVLAPLGVTAMRIGGSRLDQRLPGTATLLIRRHDGLNIAVLFNSRVSPASEHLTKSLDGPLHQALAAPCGMGSSSARAEGRVRSCPTAVARHREVILFRVPGTGPGVKFTPCVVVHSDARRELRRAPQTSKTPATRGRRPCGARASPFAGHTERIGSARRGDRSR